MKKLTISVFALFTIFSFGQEKEIKEAFTSFESGNKSQAQTLIQQVESTVVSKASGIEPDVYVKYLYVKGNTLLEQKKTLEAAKVFSELSVYEKGPVYSLKNKNTKEKAFVILKAEADKLQAQGFSNLKETKSGTDYSQKVIPVLDKKRQEVVQVANNDYNAKNYEKAAASFLEAYYLSKALGLNDDDFKYYAALSYHAANNTTQAVKLYTELINEGFTGKKTTYTAVQNGQKVGLTEQQYNTFKSLPNSGFSEFKVEETPSVEAELYSYAVSLLISEKKYNEALSIAEKGIKNLPDNKNLNDLLGELYFHTGQTEKYVAKLKEAIQKNPKNYTSMYNIGVLYSKNPETYNLAKEYYDKAIQAKPDYADAYLNMSALILSKDSDLVSKMNALGTEPTDVRKYKYYSLMRQNMFKEALPYMEKAYGFDKKNLGMVKALKEAYRILKMENKEAEMAKAEQAL